MHPPSDQPWAVQGHLLARNTRQLVETMALAAISNMTAWVARELVRVSSRYLLFISVLNAKGGFLADS